MKFHWGTGIALFYSLFVLTMIGVVIISRQHDPGLVSKNYYDLDMHYQEHMEKKQNTANLPVAPAARYDLANKAVVIQFPEDMVVNIGYVKCFRSAVVGDDFIIPINPGTKGQVVIPNRTFHQGRWHIELDWEANNKKYFYSTSVILPSA